MTQTSPLNSELTWEFMTPMEQALYGAVLASHLDDFDSGLTAADAAITRLRDAAHERSRLPEPEDEAARAGLYIGYEAFADWYPVQHMIRHGHEPGYQSPTEEQIQKAYECYEHSRNDFY